MANERALEALLRKLGKERALLVLHGIRALHERLLGDGRELARFAARIAVLEYLTGSESTVGLRMAQAYRLGHDAIYDPATDEVICLCGDDVTLPALGVERLADGVLLWNVQGADERVRVPALLMLPGTPSDARADSAAGR
jgi:hypothetical protein